MTDDDRKWIEEVRRAPCNACESRLLALLDAAEARADQAEAREREAKVTIGKLLGAECSPLRAAGSAKKEEDR